MNRKQGVIIVTLLVLIICAGILATKINSPLYVDGTDISKNEEPMQPNKKDDNKDDKKTGSDYFTEAKLAREQENNAAIETLKSIIDEKNVSQESRDNAANQSTQIATNQLNEKKIETALQGKGYKDVVCRIDEGNKATIIVKSKENLTDQQAREIKNTAMSIIKLENIEIEVHE